jgi:tetratricopeptide (TPR) repeat protein/glycosyltransferase involved in cell wall biosynthesis
MAQHVYSTGGTETLAMDLASALRQRGHQASVLFFDCRVADRLKQKFAFEKAPGDFVDASSPHAIASALVNLRADAAILLFDISSPFIDLVAAWKTDCKKLLYPNVHNLDFHRLQTDQALAEKIAAILESFDGVAVMFQSSFAARFLSRFRLPFYLVETGTPRLAPRTGSFRQRHSLPSDSHLLVVPGLLTPLKNQINLIEAVPRVRSRVTVVFMGAQEPSPYGTRCLQMMQANPNCRYLGAVSRGEVASAYMESSLCLFPSVNEGAGLVLLEAMQFGLPWLTTPAVALASELKGGLIAPVEEFPERIDELLAHPERCRALGAAGRRQFENTFTLDQTVARFEAVLRALLRQSIASRSFHSLTGVRGDTESAGFTSQNLEGLNTRQEPKRFGEYLKNDAAVSSVPAKERRSSPLAHSVVWLGAIYDPSGYADEARNFVLNLQERGCDLAVRSIGRDSKEFRDRTDCQSRRALDSLLEKQVSPPFICVIHGPGYSFERSHEAAYCIGRTMFETDRLPPDWVEKCNRMDEIWVPSQATVEGFRRAGVRVPITKIPAGVDIRRFRPGLEPYRIPGARQTVFLSIFEWIYRKGWDVLLAAWAKEFKPTDDVCLVLRTYPVNGADRPDARNLIERRIDSVLKDGLGLRREDVAPIVVMAEQVAECDLPRLYAAATAYVSPSRGEGWGRTPMEAMACGLPTIATRWGGTQDFMNDQNSLLIDCTMVEVDERCEVPFYRGHQWAEPSLEHLGALLRKVVDERSQMAALGQRAREDMVRHWQWQRVVGIVEDRLREIEQELCAKRIPKPSLLPAGEPASVSFVDNRQDSCALPVLWTGLFYSASGYAEEARNFVRGLERRHLEVAIRSFAQPSETFRRQLGGSERERLDRLLAKQVESPFIGLVHTSGRCLERLPGAAYCIGRTMFETDRLPQDWVEKCNRMDEIWVPTEHSLESFRNSGVTARLIKIPGGVDSERFRPGLNPLPIPGRRRTVFLSIFEWSYRKGWDVLLHAWAKAFKPQDDVCLVLRAWPLNNADAPDTSREINLFVDAFLTRIMKLNRADLAPILVLGQPIPEGDLPRLYAAASAYVAPSRGEGWGRPQMDAMACGLPVIATGWSGTREFMTEQNSLLLDYRMVEVGPESEVEYFRGHRWAEPSREHLVQLFRRVVEQSDEMARIGARARQDMVEKWQWDRVAGLAAERLAEIVEGLRSKFSNQLSVASDQLSGADQQLSESAIRNPQSAIESSVPIQELARQDRIPGYKRGSVHSMNDPSRKDDAHGSIQKPNFEIGPVSAEANRLLERADAEYRKGNLTNARAVLLEALQHLPDSPRIQATLGAISFSLNEFDAARECFAKAAALAPNDPGVRVQLALAHLELDQIDEFEAALGRAIELDPNHRDALKLLADLNLKQGQFTDAARTYAKIVTKHPEDLESLLGLGACFFKANEWETAQEVYERILTVSPNHSLAANNLAAIKKKIEERAAAFGKSNQYSVTSDQPSVAGGQLPEDSAAHAQLATHGSQPSTPHSALRTPHSEIDRLLDRAERESQDGNHSSARQILEQALRSAPNEARVLERLGTVAFTLNDFNAAQQHFSRLAEIKPSEASAFVQLALTHLRLERIDQFEMALGRALDLDPHHRDALKLLADLNLRNDQFKDAAQTYTRILSRYPDDLDALLPLGVCFFKLEDLETAKLVFDRVLEKYPGNAVAQENLEVIRQRLAAGDGGNQSSVASGQLPVTGAQSSESEIRNLKSEIEDSALRAPQSAIEPLVEQAEAEHKRGNLSRAKELLLEALRLERDDPRALTAAGTVCFALNELDQAYRHLQRASEVDRRDPAVLVQLALVNFKLDQIEEFEVALSRALEIDPHHRDALKLLGDLNFQNNRLKDAAQAYTKILSRHPDDLEALLPLGVCFFKDGDLETAQLVFERALERHPDNEVAKENLAAVRQKLAGIAESHQPSVASDQLSVVSNPLSEQSPIRNPQSAIEGSPTAPRSSSVSDAGDQTAQSALPNPHSPINKSALAKLMDQANFFCEVGNREAALETLDQAVEMAPRDPQIRSALGSLHFTQGNYEAAREQFRRLIEVKPRDVDAYTRLAMACLKVDRIEEMEAALGLALEIDPHHREALKFLAKTNLENNRVRDAGRAYAKLLERCPDDLETLLSLALCFYRGADFESARMVYNRVLESDPNNVTARENLYQLDQMTEASGPLPVVSDQVPQTKEQSPGVTGQKSEVSGQSSVISDQSSESAGRPPPSAIADLDRLLAKADAAVGSQNLAEARDALKAALEFAPDSPEILSALGTVCFQLGDLREARLHLDRLVQIAPSDPVKWVQLALCSYQLGESAEFESALSRALALDANCLDALRLRAQVDFNQGKTQSAAQTFGKILKQTPDDLEILMPLGVCFFRTGDCETAKMVFERILELEPDHALAKENLKVILDKLRAGDGSGELSGAGEQPSDSALRTPHSEIPKAGQRALDEQLSRANALWSAGDLGGALAALREARNESPESHEICAALGSVLYQKGDLNASYEELQQATQMLPNSSDYQTRLALVLLALDRIHEFETVLGRVLDGDPAYRPALRLLADLNFREGRLKDAAQTYHKILLQAPDDTEVMLPLAVCFYKTGDIEAAKMVFERVLQIDPQNAVARENLDLITKPSCPLPPPFSQSAAPEPPAKKKR